MELAASRQLATRFSMDRSLAIARLLCSYVQTSIPVSAIFQARLVVITLSVQNAHFPPLVPKPPYPYMPLSLPCPSLDVLDLQQVILLPKRPKMRKQRVEMRLRPHMQQVLEMGMIDVSKDTKQLAIDVFDG